MAPSGGQGEMAPLGWCPLPGIKLDPCWELEPFPDLTVSSLLSASRLLRCPGYPASPGLVALLEPAQSSVPTIPLQAWS